MADSGSTAVMCSTFYCEYIVSIFSILINKFVKESRLFPSIGAIKRIVILVEWLIVENTILDRKL